MCGVSLKKYIMLKTLREWQKEGKTLRKATQGTYMFITKKHTKNVKIIQMKVLFNQNQVEK